MEEIQINKKCTCEHSTGSTYIECCNICGLPLGKEKWHFFLPEDLVSRVELPVILRCRNCNKPIKEFLRIDTDEDETICLPFCDEQCMDAYKEQDPDYFN